MACRRRRIGIAGMLALALEAPAASAVPVTTKTSIAPLPPYAGAYQPTTVDERGLWMIVDEDERKLRDSTFVVSDPALNAYVRHVLCRTVGDERCKAVRIYIMRVPAFNASMLPNGAMQVWTGALLRLHSEAELAALLGHEFAHFEERHGLVRFQQTRRNTDVAMWASLLGGGLIATAAIGGIFAFSREQEKAADVKSASYLAASPYRVAAFPDIWTRLLDEDDATAAGRKRKSKRNKPAGFFATHPTNLERLAYLRALAGRAPPDGIDNAAEYRAAIATWQPRLIDDQIKLNDFAGTDYLLAQSAAAAGWTPDLLFARGELYRQRGNPRDFVAAAGFYRDAIAQGGTAPELWRGLGLVLLRGQSPSEGRDALRTYLAKSPGAPDRPLIASLVE